MNRKSKDDDSDDEDYRKGYMKARKDKPKSNLPPPDFENADFLKFNQQFAKNLLQQRGLEITEQELGIKKPDNARVKKPANFVQGGFASLGELQNALVKAQGNIVQTLTILKDILSLENQEDKVLIRYSVIRAEFLVKNRQYDDCKILCEKALSKPSLITDRIRLMIALSQAQAESNELWDGYMQLLRCQGQLLALRDEEEGSDDSQLNLITPYDQNIEDILRSVENHQLSLKVKAQKDRKTLGLLMVQGMSSTGCLGLGDEVNEAIEFAPLATLRGRQIISLSCGEHHVLALVSGCGCMNPFDPRYECKGSSCNEGYEVMGWGENFLGQAVGNRKYGNFISQPMIVGDLSKKGVVGVVANKSTSLAWSSDGQVYRWGVSMDAGQDVEIAVDKTLSMKNIVQAVIGLNFVAILDMNRSGTTSKIIIVYLSGKMQTTRSTQALINFRKPQKLECKAIIQITAGDNHLLALDDEGAIFGIGSNEFGQLGMRPSDGLFHQQTKELTKIESACFISANQNLSLAITLEGELLYMGELTELKLVDYPKSAQLPPDAAVISTHSYGGQIFALSSAGQVYKWDPDNEPRFKLFQKGPIREMQLGRGIRVFRNTILRGSYCSLGIKPDEDGSEPTLATFEDIALELTLKDEFGDYGIKFTHPVRLHYFVTKKPSLSKKEIIDISQLNALKQSKSKQDNQLYPFKILDNDEGKLIKFDTKQDAEEPHKWNIHLQVSEAGIYQLYVLVNEELVNNSPIKLTIIKSEKEDELAKQQQEQDNAKKQLEEELLRKKLEKQQQDDLKRKRQEEEKLLQEQKLRETQQRADEALRAHNLKKQEEQQKLEEERKLKKDLLTGGGFDLEKLKAQQQLKAQTNTEKETPGQQNIQNIDPMRQPQQRLSQITTQQIRPQQSIPQQPQQQKPQQATQRNFQIRQTENKVKGQAQSVAPQQSRPSQATTRPQMRPQQPHRLPVVQQMQRSAVQQALPPPSIPRRNVNSVQQVQRMVQTSSQFNSPSMQYQMSRTETKLPGKSPAVQNLMDPFQAQVSMLAQSPNKKGVQATMKR